MTVGLLGYGRFGHALGMLLAEAGVAHKAFDRGVVVPQEYRAESARELVQGAEFVIVAVPIAAMRQALAEIRPHLEPSQVVLDVGSVKVHPVAALSDVLGAEFPWVGTHPLFGPVSLALAERPLRVVVCPSPMHPAAAERVKALYERIGCEVIEQTPESHDRVMAHTHALTFFVAKGMIDAGAGMDVPFAPPSFQAIARSIATVRSDGGHLFAAIARDNPFAAEARKQLVQALSSIDRALDAQAGGQDPAPPPQGEPARIAIPDLGERSPELKEAREHIDEIDVEIVQLLARRIQLAQRAAHAKAKLGAAVLDGVREAEALAARRGWAKDNKLDPDGVVEVFQAIMTMARRSQRT